MTDHPKFTDRFFEKAIEDISANDTLSFTRKQFHYFLDRRLKRKSYGSVFGSIFAYLFYIVILSSFFAGAGAVVFSIFLPSVWRSLLAYSDSGLAWIAWLCSHVLYLWIRINASRATQSSSQVRQLYAAELQGIGTIVVLVGIVLFVSTPSLVWWLTIAAGLLTLLLGILKQRQAAKRWDDFLITQIQINDWLDRWIRANGSVKRLLLSVSKRSASTLQSTNEPSISSEITAYSFDRAVICQNDVIAQMLIANSFHFENNCAILSISGYPQSILDTTMQMLRRNPALMVYAFHDCSPSGVALAAQLRADPKWFPDPAITIVDLGLSPRQILTASQGAFVQNDEAIAAEAARLDPSVKQSLSAEELRWLESGNTVALESFTPQRLIRVLIQGISMSQQADLGAESDFMLSDTSEAGYFYGVESFG